MKALTTVLFLFVTSLLNAQVINVIGDSYVANHRCPVEETWHYKLAKKHNFTYNNYGRNGSCIAFDRTNDGPHNFGPAMWQRYVEMDPNADYVIIIAGHNDAEKCGENMDSLRMFADSLEVMLTGIEQHCPKAKIGFVTPWYIDRPGFEPVCKVIREACYRRHIPMLWNYNSETPIKVWDADFRSEYFQSPDDYAHLNAAGHDLYLPYAEEWFVEKMEK